MDEDDIVDITELQLNKRISSLEQEHLSKDIIIAQLKKEKEDFRLELIKAKEALSNEQNGSRKRSIKLEPSDQYVSLETPPIKREFSDQDYDVQQQLNDSRMHTSMLARQLMDANREVSDLEKEVLKANKNYDKVVAQNGESNKSICILKYEKSKLEEEISKMNESMGRVAEHSKRCNGSSCEKSKELKQKLDGVLKSSKEESRRYYEVVCLFSMEQRNELVDTLEKQAKAAFEDKKYDHSMDLYLEAIMVEKTGQRDNVKLGAFWYGIATCWASSERFKKALYAIDKAITYDSNKAEYFYARSFYHNKLGEKDKAIADLNKTVELDPNGERAKLGLAKFEM